MKIRLTDDFDVRRIAQSGQCFRWNMIDDDTCRIVYAGRCLYMRTPAKGKLPLRGTQAAQRADFDCVSSARTETPAQDTLTLELDCDEQEYAEIWAPYFDMDENYAAIRARIDRDSDAFLYEASEHQKGIRILRQEPWEALISFIISQNRNIPAIKNSIELLSRRAGERRTDRRGKEYYTFPTPEAVLALSDEELKDCRLGYRDAYVRRAAEQVVSGELDLEALKNADDETAMNTLTAMYGVGKKVASCMLLYGLHHLNAFPIDVWVKRILADYYPEGYPFEKYAPYNGVYQQYMFAYYRG